MDVLLIGEHEHAEFREAVRWLHNCTRVHRVKTIKRATEFLAAGDITPQILVLAQARPDRFSTRQVEQLHEAAPLARLVALLGSWCEGELRTGSPWPGVTRVYWHQWRPRFTRELGQLSRGGMSSWSLPRTATPAEAVLDLPTRTPSIRGLCGIHAARFSDFDSLSDACAARGLSAVWLNCPTQPHVRRLDLLLVDGIACDAACTRQIEEYAERFPTAPLIALFDFVRGDDHREACAAGANAALAKPFLLADLVDEISHVLRTRENEDSRDSAA